MYVVERLGRYSRLLHPASDAAPLLPFVDKVVAAYTTRRVDQNTPASGVLALAAGRIQVHVHAAWTVKVLDPKRLAYRIADVDRCIHMLVHVRIRDALAALPHQALHTLASPNTLAAMSDAVRQNVHETAQKFGVACPALTISAITPFADAEIKPHHHPFKLPKPPAKPQGPITQPPPQKPRSLNLAEPNAPSPIPSDPNEFDTVLPELPAHNSPVKIPLPPKFEDSSEDDESVNDSSTENRPENMPVSPRDPALRPQPGTKGVIYAPPPSPSQGDLQREMHTADMLPTLISRVLTNKEQFDDGIQITTDSSYDDMPPPLPPSPKPLPPSPPPPPPPPDDDHLNGDFTPDLAKYLDGLPPTPSTDLPSSETSTDPPDRAVDPVASRGLPDEAVSMDTRFSRVPDEPDGSVERPEVHQESLPPFPFENMKENPFDPVEPVDSVEQLQILSMETSSMLTPSMETPSLETPFMGTSSVQTPSMQTPSMQTPSMDSPSMQTPSMQTPSTPTNPASAESLPIEEDSDGLSNKAVLDKDVDSIDDDPSSSSLPEPSRGSPVTSSIKREPRRLRQQQPTASVFQSVIGKAERAIKSATSDMMEGPMRLISAQSNTQRIAGPGPTDAARADGRRALPPRPAKMIARKPATRPAPRRIGGERRRVKPAMAEYQPESKRLPPPLPMPMPVEQTQVFPPNAASYPSLPDFSESSKEHIEFREGMATSHRAEGTSNQRRVKKDGEIEERRKRREDSGLRSRKEEEMLSSKEHARREKLMDTLASIEKSQVESLPPVDKFHDIEHRDTWAEANSDSGQEVFFDAQDAITPPEPIAPSEPRHSSRRRHKSRHSRKNSRYEDGYYAEGSSSEDECPECAQRHYDSYHQEEPDNRRARSRLRSESPRRRVHDGDEESDSEGFSSSSRGRREKRSGDCHRNRSERSEHSSRDRPHKKSSSRERKTDRPERSERSERSERTEKSERSERRDRDKSERSERTVVLEKSEREHTSSRSKSEDRKRSHQKEKSRSSKKSSRDVEPERDRKRKESKSRSKKKHKRAPPPTVEYSNPCTEARSIYRHRLPDSDSGIENPIPWYCEGQSAPDDTDIEGVHDRSSESESNVMDSVQTTTTYSSYGRRLKNGRRRRAHHSRTVTFLYDDW